MVDIFFASCVDLQLEYLEEQIFSLEEQTEKSREFLNLLQELKAARNNEIEQAHNRTEAFKSSHLKREREHRINAILSLIVRLRGQLLRDGFRQDLAARLSLLQTELLWLMIHHLQVG